MFNHRQKMLLIACLTLALAVPYASATAQNVKGLNDNSGSAAPPVPPLGEGSSQFLIEPEAQIKGDNIKQHTFRSQAVGQNKNWDLDIGRFQGSYKEDPNRALEDLDSDTFSGMRLRLPFRGRTEQ